MIDLHTHTAESDGTLTPAELVAAAAALPLEALGISDHDTFTGYDQAVPLARQARLDLVCGIELSTKWRRGGKPGTDGTVHGGTVSSVPSRSRSRSVHMLGYFLCGPPSAGFRAWLEALLEARRERNRRLAARLQSFGIGITIEEAEGLGRRVTGRPHFARLMVVKGYASTIQEAFDLYLAESAKAYVEREEPELAEGIRRILEAGGLPSLAHPVRHARHGAAAFEKAIVEMRGMGLGAIEVYHSDHGPADVAQFESLARRYGLAITGGTDFHGANKPGLALGTGYGNVAVPRRVLDDLREASVRP
jgi:predicted metal-dependent phosphoesterase TrpH